MKDEKQPLRRLTHDEWKRTIIGTLVYGGFGLFWGMLGARIAMVICGILALWRAIPALVDPFIPVKKDQNKG